MDEAELELRHQQMCQAILLGYEQAQAGFPELEAIQDPEQKLCAYVSLIQMLEKAEVDLRGIRSRLHTATRRVLRGR
jgi:hypothetical protein